MTVGDDASSAIQRFDWNGDELFVLASSRGGVLRRVFLGDMTYKLVRATPVPAWYCCGAPEPSIGAARVPIHPGVAGTDAGQCAR